MQKFTIEITEEEYKEIKSYLPENVSSILDRKIGKILKRLELKKIKLEKIKERKDKKKKYYNARLSELAKERRQYLIENATHSEKIFKAKLKSIGIIYEFQKIVYTEKSFYILDFYIPSLSLIIELDGGYHNTVEQKKKDIKRTKELKDLGYKNIRRFKNEEAINIKDLTLREILK